MYNRDTIKNKNERPLLSLVLKDYLSRKCTGPSADKFEKMKSVFRDPFFPVTRRRNVLVNTVQNKADDGS